MRNTRTIDGGVGRVEINKKYVIKKYKFDKISDDESISYFISDVSFMNILNDCEGFPNILSIFKSADDYCIKMPYLGEPIEKHDNYLEYFIKILKKVKELHDHNIVHCDLKFGNILLDKSSSIHIIDYSHSKISDNNNNLPYCKTALQTYSIMAPESYNGKYTLSNKLDIWSLGCILYELITGSSLFTWETKEKAIEQHNSHTHIACIKKNINDKTDRKLLFMLLDDDPNLRPTVDEILEYLGCSVNVKNVKKHNPSIKKSNCYQKYINILAQKLMNDANISTYKKRQFNIIAKLLMVILLTNDSLDDSYKMNGNKCYEYIRKTVLSMNIIDCFKGWYL